MVLMAGIAAGWLLRKSSALVGINQCLTRFSLWALLGVMGAKLALHRALFMQDMGVFFAAIGSSAALIVVFFLFFWAAGLREKNGGKANKTRILRELRVASCELRDEECGSKRACGDRPLQRQSEMLLEKGQPPIIVQSGIGWHELLSVAANGGCVLAGFMLFLLLPENHSTKFPIDSFTDWLLRALLFFIGFDLGAELHRLDLRLLTPKLLLAPFLNIALSLAVGLLFGMLSGLGGRQGTVLTAGMGWYSLSSVLLADRGMMLLSILSFIHNVFRELLAILCAPLAAKLSPMLPVYLGGATSMDVMLPFVQRHCGKEYTLVSFYSGVICSIAVLPLVKIIAG
jgi:uncharacterized membrane protein YbjE (DUF340 family)